MSSKAELKPLSNRAGKKSKSGCKTCKERKVKCDEKKPACANCLVYFSYRIDRCNYDHGHRGHHRPLKIKPRSPIHGHAPQEAPQEDELFAVSVKRIYSQHPPLLVELVGMPTADPFRTHIKSQLPNADQLLHHYLSQCIGRFIPVGRTAENNPFELALWSLVQSDTVLHHAALLLSALIFEGLRQKPNSMHSEVYVRECVRLIRAEIDNPAEGIGDPTIIAVAMLAAIEDCHRNVIMVKLHVDGLIRMVSIRGGLEKMRDETPIAATFVYWVCLIISQQSQFPPEDDRDPLSRVPGYMEGFEIPTSIEMLDLESFGVDPEVSCLVRKMRFWCAMFSAPVAGDRILNCDIHSSLCSLLQRLLHVDIVPEGGSRAANISDATRWAAAIFSFLPFTLHWPDPTLTIRTFLCKLICALCRIVPSSGAENPLIVWLLAIGGASAYKMPEREWFVDHLVVVTATMQLRSWDEMRSCLKRVLWIDTYLDRPFKKLWDEVQGASESLVEKDPFAAISYCAAFSQGAL